MLTLVYANFAMVGTAAIDEESTKTATVDNVTRRFCADEFLPVSVGGAMAKEYVMGSTEQLKKSSFHHNKWIFNAFAFILFTFTNKTPNITIRLDPFATTIERRPGIHWDDWTEYFAFQVKVTNRPTKRKIIICLQLLRSSRVRLPLADLWMLLKNIVGRKVTRLIPNHFAVGRMSSQC